MIEAARSYLNRMIEKQRVAHSLLFVGKESKSLAMEFAGNLLQSRDKKHPDLHLFCPEGKSGMHSLDSIRRFTETVYLSPFSALWKIFILEEADRMLPYSANALLKTFEEPPEKTVIILLSSCPENLLPTIRSRCQIIRLKSEIKNESFNKNLLDALSTNQIKNYEDIKNLSQKLADELDKQKEECEKLLKDEHANEIATAYQKDLMEKEILGTVAMRARKEVEKLFICVLSWYRDMELIHYNGDLNYLINKQYQTYVEQAIQRGEFKSLEKVQKIISESMLAYDRFTSLNLCLESFFLKLAIL